MLLIFRAGRARVLRAIGTDCLFAACLGLFATLAAASAFADWSESFDDAFDQSWTFAATDDIGNPPSTGVSEFARIEAGVDDYLRISHSTTAFADGGGGATDGFGFVSEVFTDVAMAGTINAASGDGQQSVLGVFARGNAVSGNAYVAGVSFADDFFAIARNDNLFDFLVPLATDVGLALDPAETYVVVFWIEGAVLRASLVEASTSDVVSTLSATDFSYASGVSGVLVQTAYDPFDNPIGPIVGTFDNVSAVPEPGFTFGLALSLAGLAGAARAKRRSRGALD